MIALVEKLLGVGNEGEIKRLRRTMETVNALEPRMQALTDAGLRALTDEFKERLAKGETLEDILPEAYAAVREAGVRTVGFRAFDEQVMAAIVLHQGRIAEQKTGEGKTFTAVMAAYLSALTGEGVHVVTVNDYLAKFQGEGMGRTYRFMGLSVGLILHDMEAAERKRSYAADITYGTNNEYGFDYLRDNMVLSLGDRVQRSLAFAIVDEVDSILIDEARTPLIISGAGDKSTELYGVADRFAARLRAQEGDAEKDPDAFKPGDFVKDEKQRSCTLTDAGVKKAEAFFGVDNLSDIENTEINHHVNQALKARFLMARDVDYVVKDGQVIIVDEFTGRLMTGRRYSDGLHQAIEAKEGVNVEHESKTLATITFQNYFRMYKKLSGMTGTAKTEEEEFKGIYKLDVVVIPTHMPMIRQDFNDIIYRKEAAKFAAVVDEIVDKHKTGQPILVGTVSVEKSEMLSSMLRQRGIEHVVLNAKHHEREAEIVAQAGKLGAVTIATNMAGRGTDIILGGNPEYLARKRLLKDFPDMPDDKLEDAQGFAETRDSEVLAMRERFRAYLDEYKRETVTEHNAVVEKGGLHIIGTERHESRRIDNQLRGRAGRQGDPGSSRFYISLEDELMRLFGGERVSAIIERLGMEEEQPIEYGILSKQIESAQKRVEGRNYDVRKHVLQYDDVMNTQREVIYGQRTSVLEGQDLRAVIMDMAEGVIKKAVDAYCPDKTEADEWELSGLHERLSKLFPLPSFAYTEDDMINLDRKRLLKELVALHEAHYATREEEARKAGVSQRDVERAVMLRVVDQKWMDHIDAMDQLRQGIGLRAYGQRDPAQEYKFEGYEMFSEMIDNIQEDTVTLLNHIAYEKGVPAQRRQQPTVASHGGSQGGARRPAQARAQRQVGRNEPCPCGSGKKYKHCHGAAGAKA